jgi:tetratricopeptide (TPR) repeat protein
MPAMPADAYGLPVSTTDPEALTLYDRAVEAMLAWQAEALPLFRAAAERDAGLALAHAGAAVCLFLEERFPETKAATDAARAAATGQSERERSHVAALTAWTSGQVPEAESLMRAHLTRWPRDAMVLQRLYYILFWLGRFPDMLALTDSMRGHYPGSSFVLGMHAFALEEADRCAEAIRVAEHALALRPNDAWSVHALAHALYESADFDAGVTRLPPAIHPCRGLNWFRNHLLWHLALIHFARGEYARAAAMGRRVFELAPSSIAGDLHDSISLLWRLELAGRPVGERWRPFAAIARERLTRMGLLFHVAHMGMALAAGGDWEGARAQLDAVRGRAARDKTGLMADVLVPLLEGLHAFAAGDYRTTIERIEPLRPRIVELGGSRAQRDVFHDTLFEAAFRAGDAERAGRYLAERLVRRRDHFWLTRRPA